MTLSNKTPINPFKDISDLREEVTKYINAHKTVIHSHAKRLSDYFEMCCFNYIVRFYENKGYSVQVENLQDKKYRYKLTTAGYASRFSYFSASKTISEKGNVQNIKVEIRHNIAVQSKHQSDIFTTPDIVVVMPDKIVEDNKFYFRNRVLSYIPNSEVLTFCEAKQFTPFPELLFSFIGTVNELRDELLKNNIQIIKTDHIAPSLMISGKGNQHTDRIRDSLQQRYWINILFDLFQSGVNTFSKRKINKLRGLKHKN